MNAYNWTVKACRCLWRNLNLKLNDDKKEGKERKKRLRLRLSLRWGLVARPSPTTQQAPHASVQPRRVDHLLIASTLQRRKLPRSANTLQHKLLKSVKAWSHNGPIIMDNDPHKVPLPFDKLALGDLACGGSYEGEEPGRNMRRQMNQSMELTLLSRKRKR